MPTRWGDLPAGGSVRMSDTQAFISAGRIRGSPRDEQADSLEISQGRVKNFNVGSGTEAW